MHSHSVFWTRHPVIDLTATTVRNPVTRVQLEASATRCAVTESDLLVATELREYLDGARMKFTFAIEPTGAAFAQLLYAGAEAAKRRLLALEGATFQSDHAGT